MTFTYTVNFQTTSEGNSWWKLKELLVAAGWSVARSGDGLAAFSNSGDVLSAGGPYPITGANSLDNTSAWMELRAPLNHSTGTGVSFAFSSPTVTLTVAASSFVASDVGKFIQIAGSTTPANDGYFLITSYISATSITYKNNAGVAEAYTGTWTIAERPRRSILIQKTSTAGAWRIWYDSSDSIKSGVGDSFTQSGSATTFVDSTATFVSGDVGKTITIQGATSVGNNGVFVIKTFTSATTIVYENVSGVTEAYTGTWKVLSSDGFKWGLTGIGTTPGITNPAGSTFRLTAANSIATTNTSGTGSVATITFATQTKVMAVGATIVVAGVTPAGYNTAGATVTAATATTVSYANATTGAQTVAGTVTPQFVAGDVGKTIRITGATSPGNNGDFVVTAQTGTTLDWTNASGVVEAYVQNWYLDRPMTALTRPFGSDEQGIVNTPSGTTIMIPQNVAGVFFLDVIVGNSSEGYSFFWGTRRFSTQGYGGVLAMDVPSGAHAFDVDPAVIISALESDTVNFATTSGSGTTGPMTTTLAQTSGGARGWFKKALTGAAYVSYPIFGWGSQEGSLNTLVPRSNARNSQNGSNEFQEIPCHYLRGGTTIGTERGYRGQSRIFRSLLTTIGQHRNNVGRTRMALGSITIPWDGSTAPIF